MEEITVTGGNSTGGELLENSSETFRHASETFYPTLYLSTYVKRITNRDWRIRQASLQFIKALALKLQILRQKHSKSVQVLMFEFSFR